MTQPVSNSIENDQYDDLSTLEGLIQQEGRREEARQVLRHILSSQTESDCAGDSIGDVLARLAKQPAKHEFSAIVVLRCLAIHNLLPESNSKNQIQRSTVELCESSLPEIVKFLKFDVRAQNYEKFEILSGCHKRITELLDPLRVPYGDLDALLNARKDIAGCLNHSMVRTYAKPFKLNEIRSIIESIFSKLKKVSTIETSLLIDIDECNRAISSVKNDSNITNSFLRHEYLLPFLSTCENILSNFMGSHRAKFDTAITWGGGPGGELQKRYPLHEAGREIQIIVPLRNSGPGMATDVRLSVEDTSGDIALNTSNIMLGNVLPGEFSIPLDAIVLSPCPTSECLLNIEWGEIGQPTRKSELFSFKMIAQSSDIDWSSLEYFTPYTTEVARDEHFVGRTDRVHQLAANLLRSPMQPFYVTGQKRVGKTSLALAAAQFAKVKSPANTFEFQYILWGEVAHAEPSMSVRQLGENLETFITNCLPSRINVEKGN